MGNSMTVETGDALKDLPDELYEDSGDDTFLLCPTMYQAMDKSRSYDLVCWPVLLTCDAAGVADLPRYGHLILGFRSKKTRVPVTVSIGKKVKYQLDLSNTSMTPALFGTGSLPMYTLDREEMQLIADPYCEIEALYGFMRDGAQKKVFGEPVLLQPCGDYQEECFICASGKLWTIGTLETYPLSLTTAGKQLLKNAEERPICE